MEEFQAAFSKTVRLDATGHASDVLASSLNEDTTVARLMEWCPRHRPNAWTRLDRTGIRVYQYTSTLVYGYTGILVFWYIGILV